MKILPLAQGTQEWLQFRRTKIMASDCPTIMTGSPSELLALYESKLSGTEKKVTPAMQRGKDLEETARQVWMRDSNIRVQPEVVLSDEYEWMGASLDGLSSDHQTILEIKCPGETVFWQIEQGDIPQYYKWQIQHQLCVCEKERAFLFVYSEGSQLEIVIDRDEVMIGQLIEKERDFYYNHMIAYVPPGEQLVCRDDPVMVNAMARLEFARTAAKDADEYEKQCRDEVIALADGKSFNCFGRKGVKYSKVGQVDYKRVPELKGVDLEKYRKASVECWRID